MKAQNWSKMAIEREAWKRIVDQAKTCRVVVPREEEGPSLLGNFMLLCM
jgi:hypothetical protein